MLVLAIFVFGLVAYHANSHTMFEGCNRHKKMKAVLNMYGGYVPHFISVYLSTNLRDRKRYEIKYITTFHYTTLYFQIIKKFFHSEANVIERIFFSFNLSTIYCFNISQYILFYNIC